MNNEQNMISSLYETDFYAWTNRQAELLRQGKWQALDIVNLVEEIECLGRQQRQELRNRLGILLGHLLKWDYQPSHRGKSWRVTIRGQRRDIKRLIDENPSLKSYLEQAVREGYEEAMDLVVKETPLDYKDLPKDCPYTLEEVFNAGFPSDLEDF